MFAEAIAERALGQYPLSIATSLAIESCCGIHPDYPVSSPPILQFNELWVNVRTLYRNFLGALDKEIAGSVHPNEAAQAISEEMEILSSIIRDVSSGMVRVEYYYSDYAGLDKIFKLGVQRMDNTLRQKEYTEHQKATMEVLLKHRPEVLLFTNKLLPKTKSKTLILTHYAIDLLWWKEFKELVLLESHTGKIKERAQWTDKYHEGKTLPPIPFRADLIQVFGDSQTFRPMALAIKKDVIDLAIQYNWTPVTTTDRIAFCISQMRNPYARDLLKSILVH